MDLRNVQSCREFLWVYLSLTDDIGRRAKPQSLRRLAVLQSPSACGMREGRSEVTCSCGKRGADSSGDHVLLGGWLCSGDLTRFAPGIVRPCETRCTRTMSRAGLQPSEPFTEEALGLGLTAHLDLPSEGVGSGHPVKLLAIEPPFFIHNIFSPRNENHIPWLAKFAFFLLTFHFNSLLLIS